MARFRKRVMDPVTRVDTVHDHLYNDGPHLRRQCAFSVDEVMDEGAPATDMHQQDVRRMTKENDEVQNTMRYITPQIIMSKTNRQDPPLKAT